MISPGEILAVLHDVEAGKVRVLNPVRDLPGDDPYFRLSNLWEIGVFNDATEWDYVMYAKAPDGREWRCEGSSEEQWPQELRNFVPSNESLIHNYGWLPESPWEGWLEPGTGRRFRKPEWAWLDFL